MAAIVRPASPVRAALSACALAATVVSSFAIAGPTGVPFKADLVTQEVLSFDPSRCGTAPFLVGTTSGSGNASHLGRVTGLSTDCITPTSAFAFNFSDGKLSLYAANGDELRAVYDGTLTATATLPVFGISGTYRFIGGTGRFANATGTGTIQGLLNQATNQGSLRFNGTISY